MCVLLNAWDGSKEWTVSLPEAEEALAIAAAQGWVAVATDTRNLRLFTVAGTQREVVSLPGPIVCLSGHKNRLLVVYHSGMGEYRIIYELVIVKSDVSQVCTVVNKTKKNILTSSDVIIRQTNKLQCIVLVQIKQLSFRGLLKNLVTAKNY